MKRIKAIEMILGCTSILKIPSPDIPTRYIGKNEVELESWTKSEHRDEWAQTPLVGMETGKAAYNFLKSDSQRIDAPDEDHWGIRICQFLSCPEHRVRGLALANLTAAKEIDLEGIGKNKDIPHVPTEIFKTLPTQAHATVFRQAVKSTKASPEGSKGSG